jgi:DHA1 family tetracycline resistance protein-like MFS transporter
MSEKIAPNANSSRGAKLDSTAYRYEVTVDEFPAGLRCEGSVVIVVNKYSSLHGRLQEGSRIVAVNGLPVGDHFEEEELLTLQLPYLLTLEGASQDEPRRETSSASAQEVTPKVFFDVVLMYLSIFIDLFGVTVIAPVVPYLQPIMGFDDLSLGLLTSLYNAASIPGAFLVGRLTRRRGTRGATLFSLGGSCLTLAAQGVLVHMMLSPASDPERPVWFYMFLALRVLAGATGSSMPIAFTYIGMRVPQREKPRYMAFTSVAITLAVMTGPMVGGTLANFTPQFALPFYFGAALAGAGLFVAAGCLGDARSPKTASTEAMPQPVKAIILIAPLKMLSYGSYIILGAAYYMWRFEMSIDEVGATVSLHGVIQSVNAVVLVPRILKRIGAERTVLLGSLLIAAGTATVGFMPTWWSFQLVWSPICGVGFGCCNTGLPVLADRFATQATRATMNACLFAGDQLAMFIVGAVYGSTLSIARELEHGAFFWVAACAFALLQAVALLGIWQLVLEPHAKAKREAAEQVELQRKAAGSRPLPIQRERTPTEADYAAWGKVLVDKLHQRGWLWQQKRAYVENMLDQIIVDLPTDTYQHRMEVLWELHEVIRGFRQKKAQIDDVFTELHLVVGEHHGGEQAQRESARSI